MTTYSYSGSSVSDTLPVGTYKFECWGGEGKSGYYQIPRSLGGKGGYAVGYITLLESTEIFIYVGGGGGTGITAGWNGGGIGDSYLAQFYGGGGGGASDIRTSGSELANRIIVAGGGGGGSGYDQDTRVGGYGGGLTGGQGVVAGGTGGTQLAGGEDGGVLGIGGTATANAAGAGGGGYYGGGAAPGDYDGGGGGSSYLGTLKDAFTTANINLGNGKIIITKVKIFSPVWFLNC